MLSLLLEVLHNIFGFRIGGGEKGKFHHPIKSLAPSCLSAIDNKQNKVVSRCNNRLCLPFYVNKRFLITQAQSKHGLNLVYGVSARGMNIRYIGSNLSICRHVLEDSLSFMQIRFYISYFMLFLLMQPFYCKMFVASNVEFLTIKLKPFSTKTYICIGVISKSSPGGRANFIFYFLRIARTSAAVTSNNGCFSADTDVFRVTALVTISDQISSQYFTLYSRRAEWAIISITLVTGGLHFLKQFWGTRRVSCPITRRSCFVLFLHYFGVTCGRRSTIPNFISGPSFIVSLFITVRTLKAAKSRNRVPDTKCLPHTIPTLVTLFGVA